MEKRNNENIEHGGDLVGKILEEYGVKFAFTLCGGHISPILLGCEKFGIEVIDVRHEATAVFAADAVSRLSGTPGIAMVTAGPGVTNTLTALKNAQMANTPLILLGGATATMLKGRGALQDIDQISLVKSICKWSTSVKSVKEIISALEKAFEEVQKDPKGPVFIELPVDILYPEEIVRDWYPKAGDKELSIFDRVYYWYIRRHLNKLFEGDWKNIDIKPTGRIPEKPSYSDIRDIALELENSNKPLMLLSSQVVENVDSLEEFKEVVEKLKIPVYLSGMARGLLGKDHPLQLRHKRTKALREADLIILAGVPMDFRLDYGRKINKSATLIMINEISDILDLNNNFRKPEYKIRTDPLQFFIHLEREKMDFVDKWADWLEKLRSRNDKRDEQISEIADQPTEFVNPVNLCQQIEKIIPDNSVIIVDGGDFVATLSYIVQPRGHLRWLDPGPFGTLGVGAGFALGAKLCYPGSQVWLIYGDGSAGYSLMEYDTFVRHSLPVIGVIGNDAGWTQIEREQVNIFDSALGTQLTHSNYEKVVEGLGGKGLRIENDENIQNILEEAKKLHDEGFPVLINGLIGKTDFRKGSISM